MVSGPVNELKLNLLGKVFFAACGAWILGRATNLKIRGTPEEIQAVSAAMLASRRFQEELERPGATVESVMQQLGLKHASAREFERILGVPWPLAVAMFAGAAHAFANIVSTVAT